MNAIPPITVEEERRMYERRQGWHTPETCDKVIGVQAAIEDLKKQMTLGDFRMGCIEDNIAGNHRITSDDIRLLQSKLDENTKATEESKRANAEVLEIVQMGKGFFHGVAWIGKWMRRTVMWVVPPVVAIVGLWQALTNKSH